MNNILIYSLLIHEVSNPIMAGHFEELRPKSHFEMESYFDHDIEHLFELDIDDDEDVVKTSNSVAPLPEL